MQCNQIKMGKAVMIHCFAHFFVYNEENKRKGCAAMSDKVYLKQDLGVSRFSNRHPTMVFGALLVLYGVWFVVSIFIFDRILQLLAVDGALLALLLWWGIRKKDIVRRTNSEAFIVRDRTLYYVRLGFRLEDGVPMEFLHERMLSSEGDAVLTSVLTVSGQARTQSAQEAVFSTLLSVILQSPMDVMDDGSVNRTLPAFVSTFYEMTLPRLEKRKKDWIWVSWDDANGKSVRRMEKFANAFDLSMFDKVDGGTR